MLLTVVTTLLIISVANAAHPPKTYKAMAQMINSMNTTWTASGSGEGDIAEHVRPLLGLLPNFRETLQAAVDAGLVQKVPKVILGKEGPVPESFDSAENWPSCAKVINDIRDQGNCGCCWAFAAVEAASDRACIATNGQILAPLSAADICFAQGIYSGCGGGDMQTPWSKISTVGIVTGGQNNNSKLDSKTDPFAGQGFCASYPLPHCKHGGSGGGTASDPCPFPEENQHGGSSCPEHTTSSPAGPTKCDSDAKAPHDNYDMDKITFDGQTTVHDNDEVSIQVAIMTDGPAAASMDVYSDFPTYRSGVYQPHSSEVLGGHAIKIVGWGVENGVKYWKVANSWNRFWGDGGFFKIVRGKNAAEIENTVVSSSTGAKWHKKNSGSPALV